MLRRLRVVGAISAAALSISSLSLPVAQASAASATPIQVYGSWLCGNDECTWGTVRDMTDFDYNNHWLIDRGDGQPSVNLAVLAFVNPLKLLNQTTDSQTVNGVPVGMNQSVVNYFTSQAYGSCCRSAASPTSTTGTRP